MELFVEFVGYLVVFLVELVLLLEGHVARLVVLFNQLVNLLLYVLCFLFGQFFELCNDGALLLQVFFFLVARSCVGCVSRLEEVVAGSEEVVPELVAQLLGHHADGLPLFLKGYELV